MPAAADPSLTAPTLVATDELNFDPENPRLQEQDAVPDTQEGILEVLWRDFAVDEIALSIATNGYFEYEPLFAARENGHFYVIEGNRRLAAVKLLRDSSLRKLVGATDLPRLPQSRLRHLDYLPVIEADRAAIWHYVGFKHVNGPQAWRSYSKAQYVAWVHNELRVPLDVIARQIGDRHATVLRLYRALMVVEQGERVGVFDRRDRYKAHFSFSHLFTGLGYSGIQAFIGLQTQRAPSRSPVPRGKVANLGKLLLWLYGSASREIPPLVETQNPDLRLLDEALQTPDGAAALTRGLPLKLALEAARGDERVLREALISSKQYLQEARGKLLTGYDGEADLFDTAADILELAETIFLEMEDRRSARRAAKRRPAQRR